MHGRCTRSAATQTSSIRRPESCCGRARTISFPSVHLHANGKDTTANLKIGFKFHPVGYKPQIQSTLISIGTDDLDIPGGASGISQSAYMTLSQPTKLTVFEPHMHCDGRSHVRRGNLWLAG